jgi:hypothetical protein
MDFDEIYVGMNGPKPFGVFEMVEDAVAVLSRAAECTGSDIVISHCLNGDVLLLVRNYPEARLIKTRLY